MRPEDQPPTPDPLPAVIARKAKLRLASLGEDRGSIWSGLGMSGLIGWSVTVPTLLGAMLGAYFDRRFPSVHSWTLTLLVIGLLSGCICAWYWVCQQDEAMHRREDSEDA